MNKSESIKELAAALVKAQMDMKNPGFDSKNPHFGNKFASLAAVRAAVLGPLNENGIAVIQLLGGDDCGLICETTLLHESGEWISDRFYMPVAKKDPQGYGSAATYARRYALQAICGVVGDVDDDGNEASKAEKNVAKQIANANVKPLAGAFEELDPDMQIYVQDLATEAGAMLTKGDIVGAYEHIENAQLDAEAKKGLWSLLGSKHRKALKEHGDSLKQKEAA